MHWDAVEAAGAYGRFAALVAGFALSGLLWVAKGDGDLKERAGSITGIWAAILPMAASALMYAELSGELSCEAGFIIVIIPSVLLTAGAVALFHYLGDLMEAALGVVAKQVAVLFSVAVVASGAIATWVGNGTLLRGTAKSSSAVTPTIFIQGALIAVVTIGALVYKSKSPFRSIQFIGPAVLIGLTVFGFAAFYVLSTFGVSGLPQGGFKVESWLAPTASWSRVALWALVVWAITRDTAPSEPLDAPTTTASA